VEQILNYPFNSSLILRKKKQLKNYLLGARTDFLEKNVAILGGSTTSEVISVLEIFLLANGIRPTFYESEYNMYYEDSVFENKALKDFNPEIVYIHTSNVNIKYYPKMSSSHEEIEEFLEKEIQKFKLIWKSLEPYNCSIIQNNFELPIHRSLGNLDCYDERGKTYFINRLNLEFAKFANKNSSLYINDINYLSSHMGLEKWSDLNLWFTAKYVLSFEAMPSLAHNISKIIIAIYGKSKKGLVLDLDHTIWGGVIGDDGLNGIQLGNETAAGEAYIYFQNYIKELKERGVILSIASKNDHENALLGLSHNDSVLKVEDFNTIKANWNPKNSNIAILAKEINIGLDSLVFLDDNPAEREIVRNTLPTVSVPEIGDDVTKYLTFLEGESYFEVVNILADDLYRNKYYEIDKKRQEDLVMFQSYEDFLISLNMSAKILKFEKDSLERITQLINKTNQFNLTTKRYTSVEVEGFMKNQSFITLFGSLDDKFGSNGITSLLIGKITREQCFIDTFLMSCRVLKRGMELAMFDTFVKQCRENNIKEIVGTYIPTSKNKIVENLFKELGFELQNENELKSIWVLKTESYLMQNKYIRVN